MLTWQKTDSAGEEWMNGKVSAILLSVLLFTLLLTGCWDTAGNGTEKQRQSRETANRSGAYTSGDGHALPNREKSYSYQTQELFVQHGGNQIYGVIYIPEHAGDKMPAVIFSHGFGGNYRVGEPYARALAEKGFVVYCFDFCGGSPNSRSGGSTLTMSVFTEKADLEAVIARIQGLEYVDENNLFLMGTSQGGAVSAITGAEHKDEIRGMILLYPAFVLADRANELFQNKEQIPDTYYFMWMNVGRAYFEPLLGYDIYGAVSPYDKDVLLIHGDEDSIVPLSYSERALDVYRSAELQIIPGAGHGFYGRDAQLAIDYMLGYLYSHQV